MKNFPIRMKRFKICANQIENEKTGLGLKSWVQNQIPFSNTTSVYENGDALDHAPISRDMILKLCSNKW